MPVKVTKNGRVVYEHEHNVGEAMDICNGFFPSGKWPNIGKEYVILNHRGNRIVGKIKIIEPPTNMRLDEDYYIDGEVKKK